MTNTSNTKINEVYNELKDIVAFLNNKGYGSTVLHLHFSIKKEEIDAICELLNQDGIEIRRNGRKGLYIIWSKTEDMCVYGLDISMTPSKNIVQIMEFQEPTEK